MWLASYNFCSLYLFETIQLVSYSFLSVSIFIFALLIIFEHVTSRNHANQTPLFSAQVEVCFQRLSLLVFQILLQNQSSEDRFLVVIFLISLLSRLCFPCHY